MDNFKKWQKHIVCEADFFTLGQFAVEGGTAAMCYIFLACIVNPSNPPSVAINEESMKYIKKIVEKFKERA